MFDLETMLRDHLAHNLYPPVPTVFAHDAESAIDLVLADEAAEPITMVNGVTLTAGEIVAQLHLADFVAYYQTRNAEPNHRYRCHPEDWSRPAGIVNAPTADEAAVVYRVSAGGIMPHVQIIVVEEV